MHVMTNLSRVMATLLLLIWEFASPVAPQTKDNANQSTQLSDRERTGLRGLVKRCIAEYTIAGPRGDQLERSTTLYDHAGHTLSRTNESGNPRWVQTYDYSYSADGRLQRVALANGKAGSPLIETTYTYDDSGRLTKIFVQGHPATEFQYDAQGHKSSLQMSGPKQADVIYASGHDPGSETFMNTAAVICSAVAACASIKTNYDDRDQPRELELLDSSGQVITRFVRTYDAHGNAIADRQEDVSPELMVPAELKDKLNAAQTKAAGKLFAGMAANTTSYAYDAENRLKEVRSFNAMVGQEVTTFAYNEHGDKTEEHVSRSGTEGFSGSLTEQGTIIPGAPSGGMPPEESDTRYAYLYDEYGNWTQQTVEVRSKPDEPFRVLRTVHRKLTYEPAAQP